MACAVGKASVALEESAVCSSSDSSSPTCEVSFSGITPGVPVRLTIEVAQSDFNSDSEYISLVTAGAYSMGTDFLRYTGQQDAVAADPEVAVGASRSIAHPRQYRQASVA